jgi:predicted transcriptional regulator
MTKRKLRKLSPANLQIMNIVWEKGEVTVNGVVEAINAERADQVRRTTVQVQMGRLEEYGWLKHNQKGRTFYYSAVHEKHKTRRDILNDIKNRVFGGSRSELVKCLFEDSSVNPDELEELRELLEEKK